jgi:cytoskeletal protein CcmA (bactofilin family)
MAMWKESMRIDPITGETLPPSASPPVVETPPRSYTQPAQGARKESVIGAGLTIEGKIEGEGDVRLAGSFKGDVRVKGNLIIDQGAHVSGEVSAETVTLGGDVVGNIHASNQVNLLETCQLVGDLRAKQLTVAAGSRMRGKVEFGWEEGELKEAREVKRVETKKPAEKSDARPSEARPFV